MPAESLIEWTDATWNPVTGCSKVSQGCKNCYAEALFGRAYANRPFTDVRIHPERLMWPLRWKGSKQAQAEGRPSRIFVNSMSDLFHETVEPAFIDKVFAVMALAGQHTFQVLTKRPERMESYFNGADRDGFPEIMSSERRIARCAETIAQMRGEDTCGAFWDVFLEQPYLNIHVGVSVEDQKTADERIPLLLQTPAAVRWVSYEPALGTVDFTQIGNDGINALVGRQTHWHHDADGEMWNPGGLDWIVAGGESGPHARPPHPDWFRSVRDQCQAAEVPFFFKQWGAWKPTDDKDHSEIGNKCVSFNGDVFDPSQGREDNSAFVMRFVGKRNAGCLLDGREWKEFPESKWVVNRE